MSARFVRTVVLIGFTDELGMWKRTGRRDITARVIDFDYDPNGGEPTSVTVITSIVQFASDFQTALGQFCGKTFALDQDPLAPDETPIGIFGTTFTGRRVTLEDRPQARTIQLMSRTGVPYRSSNSHGLCPGSEERGPLLAR